MESSKEKKAKEACAYLRELAGKQDGEPVPPEPEWFAAAREKDAKKDAKTVHTPYVPGPDDMIFEDEF